MTSNLPIAFRCGREYAPPTYKLGPATCLAPGPRGTERRISRRARHPTDAGSVSSSLEASPGASKHRRNRR
jgi:hypothetical protein